MSAKKKSIAGLAPFSEDEFRRASLEKISRLTFVGDVSTDGDHLLIEPYPCDRRTIFKIAARSVEVSSNPLECRLPDGSVRTLFRVFVDRFAPCSRITEGLAEDFFGTNRPDGDPGFTLATLQVQIKFGSNAEGTLTYGSNSVKCLGQSTRQYPADLTVEGVEGVDKYKLWHSTEFDADMPWAVKIWGQKGIFIHEGPNNLNDNGGESAGCIHLAPPDAENFYNWVTGRTRIQISYPW
ncbi:L,D-transpeptidase [Bradyrhizobium japonicum]|uniref:L,D-transpeptidase n=1 Tax=Bradyrhizobium japonicum TaxID=375 RepID=UPI00200E2D6F|nr:L,D-transpeptidase [Bradyrhizobium japonicum]UQE03406.1 L,D-transpeptidase [Bradyrhizobium japonicum]